MAGITTSMATSFKAELFSAGHCFNGTVTPTASVGSANTAVTGVSSMSGVAVGMTVTGTGIQTSPATYVLAVTGSNTMSLSTNTTAAISGGTLTIAGDIFKMALIKQGMAGTYSTNNVNYTDMTADEVTNAAGSAYVATGQALTNVTPTTGGTVAYIDFNDVSWTSATFSTAGCMIYNSSVRNGFTSGTNSTGGGRCCSVHDFGGSQQVSAGTFTVIMPLPNSSSAILRIA